MGRGRRKNLPVRQMILAQKPTIFLKRLFRIRHNKAIPVPRQNVPRTLNLVDLAVCFFYRIVDALPSRQTAISAVYKYSCGCRGMEGDLLGVWGIGFDPFLLLTSLEFGEDGFLTEFYRIGLYCL